MIEHNIELLFIEIGKDLVRGLNAVSHQIENVVQQVVDMLGGRGRTAVTLQADFAESFNYNLLFIAGKHDRISTQVVQGGQHVGQVVV